VFANRVFFLMAIGDARVAYLPSVVTEKIAVMGDEDTRLTKTVGKLGQVIALEQSGFCRRGNIDTSTKETMRNRTIDVLVKMKANRRWHPCLLGTGLGVG